MRKNKIETRQRREDQQKRVLYVISCGSPVARLVPDVVTQAQVAHWNVCVITTPLGTRFLDIPLLESMTGYPVRSQYKQPDEPDLLPRADALLVFPATFNTLNKWALGITDTLAVGVLCEYTGLKKPIVAVPITGEGLNSHPALRRSIRMLRRYGIHVLYEPEISPLQEEDPSATMLDALERHLRTNNDSR
jgi:phosphopantothenoylcysteine synthetase/decarboxylase